MFRFISLTLIVVACSTITLTGNFDESIPLAIEIEVSKREDVELVEEAAGIFVESTKAFMSDLASELTGLPGNFGDRSLGFFEETAALIEEAKVTTFGTSVTILVERNDDSKKVVNEFVHMMDGLVDLFSG